MKVCLLKNVENSLRRRYETLGCLAMALMSVVVQPAFAVGAETSCEERFADGRAEIISSGRDQEEIPEIREIIHSLNKKGGVFDQLGIQVPERHVYQFVRGIEIAYLMGNNGHAVGHAHDGARILSSISMAPNVLEFIPPHALPARSVYRDNVSLEEMIAVICHVAGHIHFARTSKFKQIRMYDQYDESFKLYTLMENLKNDVGDDAVDEWYYLLLTLANAQDLSRGSYQKPEDFLSKNPVPHVYQAKEETPPTPGSPTPNLLQLYTSQLSDDVQPWKKTMAAQFEKVHAYTSSYIATKVINEGLAVIFEEILWAHLPEKYRTHKQYFSWSELNKGVAYPRLDNPYYLGLQGFKVQRRKFHARPDIRDLPPIERDRAFIAFITKEFVSKYDSYDFILNSLDQEWIERKNLALLRPAGDGGTWGTPPGKPPSQEQSYPWQIYSRDPKKVIQHILQKYVDHRPHFPRVLAKNMNFDGSGVIRLFFNDEFGLKIPLDRESMVQTLNHHARFMQRPVELATLSSPTWKTSKSKHAPIMGPWWPPFPREKPEPIRPIIVRVYPEGHVEVRIDPERSTEEFDFSDLAKDLRQLLADFITFDEMRKHLPNTTPRLSMQQGVLGAVIDHVTGKVPAATFSHAPTFPTALASYQRALDKYFLRSLDLALRGLKPIKRNGSSVSIKVLPSTPQFQWDSEALQHILNERLQDTSMMSLRAPHVASSIVDQNPSHKLGQNNAGEGDWVWGPYPQGDGDGTNDEEGDGEDGDPDGANPGVGQGSNDPNYVDIPIELYGEILKGSIDLPRLRPKGGHANHTDAERDGARNSRNGVDHLPIITKKAMAAGIALTRKEQPQKKLSPTDILRRGMRELTASQWYVKDTETIPEPNYNAQVTIVVDFSGSMSGAPLLYAKKLSYDLRAVLLAKYKKVEFRFVAFDSEARVFKSADKFFKLQLGGGTSYSEGFKMVAKVQEEFPRAKWDRYVVGFGDLEDFDTDTIINEMQTVYAQSEYMGMIHTREHSGGNPLAEAMSAMAKDEQWFGFAFMNVNQPYTIEVFQKLFKMPEP